MKQLTAFAPVLMVFALVMFVVMLFLPRAEAAPSEARTIQNVIFNTAPENVTAVGTQTITPTRSFLTLNNPTVLTLTLATGGAIEGDHLMIASEVVTDAVVQTTNTTLAAAQTISQNDLLKFVYVNDQWVLEDDVDNAAD